MDWIDKLQQSDRPMALFHDWFEAAKASEPCDPEAVFVATVDAEGMPNNRAVLIRAYDETGFVFHSNKGSAKDQEISHNGKACFLFCWKVMGRQVRLRGAISAFSNKTIDDYFANRHYGSRIGAWASQQSQSLESRAALLEKYAHYKRRFPESGFVPRPDYWVGYKLIPIEMEFWQAGEFRLHDRVRLTRPSSQDRWHYQRLNP